MSPHETAQYEPDYVEANGYSHPKVQRSLKQTDRTLAPPQKQKPEDPEASWIPIRVQIITRVRSVAKIGSEVFDIDLKSKDYRNFLHNLEAKICDYQDNGGHKAHLNLNGQEYFKDNNYGSPWITSVTVLWGKIGDSRAWQDFPEEWRAEELIKETELHALNLRSNLALLRNRNHGAWDCLRVTIGYDAERTEHQHRKAEAEQMDELVIKGIVAEERKKLAEQKNGSNRGSNRGVKVNGKKNGLKPNNHAWVDGPSDAYDENVPFADEISDDDGVASAINAVTFSYEEDDEELQHSPLSQA